MYVFIWLTKVPKTEDKKKPTTIMKIAQWLVAGNAAATLSSSWSPGLTTLYLLPQPSRLFSLVRDVRDLLRSPNTLSLNLNQ